MNMKWKIILPMLGILIALVITTIIFSSMRFSGYTNILFNERIEVAVNGLKKFMSDCKNDSRIAAVSAAADKDLQKAIDTRDREEIIRLLTNSLDLYHVDFFTISDEKGVTFARTHIPGEYGDSIMNQTSISEALKGNVCTTIEEGTFVMLAVCTGVPVYNSGGKLIGAISAGVRFDINQTLDILKDHYDADFSVIYRGERIATTIFLNGERITGSKIAPQVMEQIYSTKKEYYGDVDILGVNYSAFFMPILDASGDVFSIIYAGCPNTKLILERNAMQMSVVLIGLAGLVVSVIMLFFVAGRTLKPAKQLARLVSEVTHGNMDVEMNNNGAAKDEIGLLTRDIYSLVHVVKSILGDLSRLTFDLDKYSTIDLEIDANRYSGSYKKIIDGIKILADSISSMKKTMAIMDYLDTMIYVVDFDYSLLYINRSMADTYILNRESCLEQKCYRAIRNLNEPCAVCHLGKILPEKERFPFVDYEQMFDETSGTYISGRAAIIRWVDGAQVFCNSIKDETIQAKYQEQLRAAMKKAEDVSVAKTEFLANMSHEIRTPMNGIIGFLELALDRETNPASREYLSMINENAKWLLHIINEILDISKVESGNVELETIPFSLHELLNSCKNVILPKAIEKNIDLQFDAELSISKILLGDQARIRQVLLNLLSNAIKFTDSGYVKVEVSVEKEEGDQITLQFVVKDSGIGMTDAQVKRIFEPFIQGDASTTRKYGGTGLGMAITKNILELMGSKLDIESEAGKGTTISFNLIFATTDVPVDAETSGKENDLIKAQRPYFEGDILVCEDNQMNQMVISEHLTRAGLNVEIAENGSEGIDKVNARIQEGKKPFDMILMDIIMPVMNGMEASSKIIETGTETPIVAMTANIMADDREQYKNAGMIDYIGKPFTSEELWRCLEKYLKPSGSPGSNISGCWSEDSNTRLQIEYRTYFVKSNKNMFDKIKTAMDTGDTELASQLTHTLMSNAGMIGKAALQEAAASVEALIMGRESEGSEAQDDKISPGAIELSMDTLQKELSTVLDELSVYLSETESRVLEKSFFTSMDKAIKTDMALALLRKLEPLLESGDPESLRMIDAVKDIPESGDLIMQMKSYYFGAAVRALVDLEEKLKKDKIDWKQIIP